MQHGYEGEAAESVDSLEMNALMGFVADAFFSTITDLDIDRDTKVNAIYVFSKLPWLQNDLINRLYAVDQKAV